MCIFRKNRLGFLLIELACALAILNIMALFLMNVYGVVTIHYREAHHYHQALSLARNIIERIRAGEHIQNNYREGFFLCLAIIEPCLVHMIGKNTNFTNIIVQVSWTDRVKRTVSLVAGMI